MSFYGLYGGYIGLLVRLAGGCENALCYYSVLQVLQLVIVLKRPASVDEFSEIHGVFFSIQTWCFFESATHLKEDYN